jgi:hypothetical protein
MELISLIVLFSLLSSTFAAFLISGYFKLELNSFVFLILLVGFSLLSFKLLSFFGRGKVVGVQKQKFWERIIKIVSIFLIGFNIIINLSLNVYWPPTEFDSLAMYDFRGKVISKENSVKNIVGGYQGSYPFFTSMFHGIAYEFGFSNPNFVYTIIFVCLIISFTSVVARMTNPSLGYISGLLLTTTPILFDHASIAYTNMSFTAYFGLGLVYLAAFILRNNTHDSLVGSLLLGSSAWVRAATLPYVITIWLIVTTFSIKRKKKLTSPVFLIPIIYVLLDGLWRYYQLNIIKVSSYDQRGLTAFLNMENVDMYLYLLPETIKSLFNNILNPNISGGVGYLFMGAIVIYILKFIVSKKLSINSSVGIILSLSMVINWIIVALSIYSFSKEINLWRALVHDSMQRVYISFLPIFVFSIAMFIFEFTKLPHDKLKEKPSNILSG